MNFNKINSRWKKRNSSSKKSHFLTISLILLLLLLLLLFFFFSYSHISTSLLRISNNPQQLPSSQQSLLQCTPEEGQKFLWYAPHSGFSNQLSEFRNALLMSAILNRTLIVPPILDHHAVSLGSCPKFRVLDPNQLRLSVWNHSVHLIRTHRYVSMADIIDLSSVASAPRVRLTDFRVFVSTWCGVDMESVCSKDSNTLSPLLERLEQCGHLLSGYNGIVNNCVHAVQEDCRTTVWTYQKDDDDGALDSFQPDEPLKKKKKISYVRRQVDVYKALGPGSNAELANLLSFGSLFTGPYKGSESYIDIHTAPRDQGIQSLIDKIKFLPFVPEIVSAGMDFARRTIKSSFLCAQLRLLDGQFKNHWKATFLGLKEKLETLRQGGQLPINIFLMTDLPAGNWTGSYLEDIARKSNIYKLLILREDDELVVNTAKKLVAARHGMKVKPSSQSFIGIENHCYPKLLPDILLYIEEIVCSCASLGFVGTTGSTIAETIELMRKYGTCSG